MTDPKEKFPVGSSVRIADVQCLNSFQASRKHHHQLEPIQLAYAGDLATVHEVSFYCGGDFMYELDGVPGIWHESCLRSNPARSNT
jgi:hypothetical protein